MLQQKLPTPLQSGPTTRPNLPFKPLVPVSNSSLLSLQKPINVVFPALKRGSVEISKAVGEISPSKAIDIKVQQIAWIFPQIIMFFL